MFRSDRRRQIDAVIDYFGESRQARAPRFRLILGVTGEYVAYRPAHSRWGGRGRPDPEKHRDTETTSQTIPCGAQPASHSSLVE
jgi:hypothetical protein